METFRKSEEEIKKQLTFWFLHYHGSGIELYGHEQFTLFDKISDAEKDKYGSLILAPELPVLLLRVSENSVVINTTRRFIRLTTDGSEELLYKDFKSHRGFGPAAAAHVLKELGGPVHFKTDGYVLKFELRKQNGESILWDIPTGFSGFAFWNVTKKCNLIGRKYLG